MARLPGLAAPNFAIDVLHRCIFIIDAISQLKTKRIKVNRSCAGTANADKDSLQKKPRKICIIKFQCIPKPQKKKMILNWICEYLFPNATCFEPWEKFYFLPSSFFPLWHHFHSRSSSVGMPHSRTQNVPNFSSPYKMESLQWPSFCHLSDGGSPTWTGVKPRSVWRKKSKEKYWKRDAFGAFFGSPCAIRSGSFFIPAHEAFCSKFNFQPHSGCVVVWRLGWGEQETIGRLERGSVCCLFM